MKTYELIEYYPDGRVRVSLDNILTTNHIIYPNMLVIKSEGKHIDTIKILSIWDEDGYVHFKVQDHKTGKVGELVQILDRENSYFIWSILSYEYAMKMMEEKIMNRLIVGHTV